MVELKQQTIRATKPNAEVMCQNLISDLFTLEIITLLQNVLLTYLLSRMCMKMTTVTDKTALQMTTETAAVKIERWERTYAANRKRDRMMNLNMYSRDLIARHSNSTLIVFADSM